jgi:hypothetical protein
MHILALLQICIAMKKVLPFFLLFFALYSCDHDSDSPVNPVDQLPPATQIGANTFGCLLDGEVFKPGNGPNPLDCVYQFVDGEYYFALQANKEDANFNLILIGLTTKTLGLTQEQSYQLLEFEDGNASGAYSYGGQIVYKSTLNTGEMTITKLDHVHNIISGTFYFDVLDGNGVVHQIRNGRFDMHFTQ